MTIGRISIFTSSLVLGTFTPAISTPHTTQRAGNDKASEKQPKPEPFKLNAYALNTGLAKWAYSQAKNLALGDDPTVAKFRADCVGFPEAQRPPFVLIGDPFTSDYSWHGRIMTGFAEDGVSLYTQGKGRFVMTNTEAPGGCKHSLRLRRWSESMRNVYWYCELEATTPCRGLGMKQSVCDGPLYRIAARIEPYVALRKHSLARIAGTLGHHVLEGA